MFSSVAHLTVLVLWYGTCPILQERNCEGTSLFSSSLSYLRFNLFYFIMIICNCLPGVPKSDSRPAWRLRRFIISSVEDSVLELERLWSPFATASGLVALADAHYFIVLHVYVM